MTARLHGASVRETALARAGLPARLALLGCLLALSACNLGPHRDDPITARTYQCHGADPNFGYSACDREPPH